MRRFSTLFSLFGVFLLAAGCAGSYGQGVAVYDTRVPDYRRADYDRSYAHRVDRDVRAYVRTLDRYVRLNRRQQRRISHLLAERTYRLLDRTRPRDLAYVYPFPRHDSYRQGRAVERWWRGVDRHIERQLTRRQRAEYRRLVRRYEDRYYRYDGPGKKKGHSRHGQRRRYE